MYFARQVLLEKQASIQNVTVDSNSQYILGSERPVKWESPWVDSFEQTKKRNADVIDLNIHAEDWHFLFVCLFVFFLHSVFLVLGVAEEGSV